MAKDKGVEDAIKTFAKMEKSEGGWQFWIVGKGSDQYLQELKEMCKGLGIKKSTKFWGFVSEQKKFELLARAHIFMNPSAREGWGLVNIEANAVGTPVVGYNVAGIKDSVKDGKTGILVAYGDVAALATRAMNLVGDAKRYEVYQKNCISWSNKFSWEKSTRESLKLIGKCAVDSI